MGRVQNLPNWKRVETSLSTTTVTVTPHPLHTILESRILTHRRGAAIDLLQGRNFFMNGVKLEYCGVASARFPACLRLFRSVLYNAASGATLALALDLECCKLKEDL